MRSCSACYWNIRPYPIMIYSFLLQEICISKPALRNQWPLFSHIDVMHKSDSELRNTNLSIVKWRSSATSLICVRASVIYSATSCGRMNNKRSTAVFSTSEPRYFNSYAFLRSRSSQSVETAVRTCSALFCHLIGLCCCFFVKLLLFCTVI